MTAHSRHTQILFNQIKGQSEERTQNLAYQLQMNWISHFSLLPLSGEWNFVKATVISHFYARRAELVH